MISLYVAVYKCRSVEVWTEPPPTGWGKNFNINIQVKRRHKVELLFYPSFFVWRRLPLLSWLRCGVREAVIAVFMCAPTMFILSGVRSGVGFWMLNSHHSLFHRPLSPNQTSFMPYVFNQRSISCLAVFVSTFPTAPPHISWEDDWTAATSSPVWSSPASMDFYFVVFSPDSSPFRSLHTLAVWETMTFTFCQGLSTQ